MKKLCILFLFLIFLMPCSTKKARAEQFAYTIGLMTSFEGFNLANTIIETINLLNNNEFQNQYGLDKPVIFKQVMIPMFMLNPIQAEDNIQKAQSLQNDPEIDLILVVGIDAAHTFLQYNTGEKPVFLISEHDYVENNILQSYEDSGYDNVTAFIKETSLYPRFYYLTQLLEFNNLGIIVYDNKQSMSKLYASRLSNHFAEDDISLQEFYIQEDSLEAIEQILPKIIEAKPDALIINGIKSFEMNENAWKLFEQLIAHDIPVISPTQQSMASRGALFSFSINEIRKREIFAKTIASLLTGANPRSLDMQHAYFPELTLNVGVANKLEMFLSYEVLAICQHYYYSIDTGE